MPKPWGSIVFDLLARDRFLLLGFLHTLNKSNNCSVQARTRTPPLAVCTLKLEANGSHKEQVRGLIGALTEYG